MSKLYVCHIPKTAGTSVRSALEASLTETDVYPRTTDVMHTFGYPGIADFVAGFRRVESTPRLVRGHYHLSCGRLFERDYKALVIFRDPAARVISELKHLVGVQGFDRREVRRSLNRGVIPVPDNLQTRLVRGDVDVTAPDDIADRFHVMLTHPIEDEAAALEEASQAVFDCGFFGTVEAIEPLMARVYRYLGTTARPLPRFNPAAPIDLELTPVDHELIAERNELDIRLYAAVRAEERREMKASVAASAGAGAAR